MERKYTWIFLGVSAAFFLFMTGFTGYRIDSARRANLAASQRAARVLAARAGSLAAQSTDPWGSPVFRSGMRDAFEAQPRLLLLAVRSDADGILWLLARNRAWLAEPKSITPQWRGLPVYGASRGYEALVTEPVSAGPVGAGPVVDALFVVFGREDLFPVLRDDLYLFLAFLLACGIFILIVTGLSEEHAARPGPAGGRLPLAPGPTASKPRAAPCSEPVRSLTSPATGLLWAEHLGPRLTAEIERAASMDQDLAFARVLLDTPAGAPPTEKATAEAARVVREAFPIADLVFESGRGAFSVIIPDTDLDMAVRRLEGLRAQLAERGHSASIGVSTRGARLIEENTLLVEAEISADKAHREGGNRVIGFRADPAKFRTVLSGV